MSYDDPLSVRPGTRGGRVLSPQRKLKILVPLLDSFAGGCPELPALFDAIRDNDDVEISDYSTGALIAERWDVVYIYWPEWCLRRDRGPAVTAFDATRLLTELGVAKLRGAKVVWHANNVVSHESDRLGVVDAYMRAFALLVDQMIAGTQTVMDDFVRHFPTLRSIHQRVIPIGHYRDFYPDRKVTKAEAREILDLPPDASIALSLGMVRAYKNHLPLVRCYREVAANRKDTFLVIAGRPLPDALGERLRHECRDITAVRLDLDYVPDDQIQYYLRACDFSIVPTSLASTSGSALLALSFDRPVVVPHRTEFVEWRENLGPEWVQTYEGGIRAKVLERAFELGQPSGRPDLEQYFSWSRASRNVLDTLVELVHGIPTACDPA